MKNNKGSLILVLGLVIAVAIAGAGLLYYKNNKNTGQDMTGGLPSVFNSSTSMSPKEIFLKKNTELFNAKSFDEMLATTMKYSSSAKIAEELEDIKYITSVEKKNAYFGFAQVMLVPTEKLTDITEVITGDTATVTAYDSKGQEHKSTYVKENGLWKESDSRVLVNPRPKK